MGDPENAEVPDLLLLMGQGEQLKVSHFQRPHWPRGKWLHDVLATLGSLKALAVPLDSRSLCSCVSTCRCTSCCMSSWGFGEQG